MSIAILSPCLFCVDELDDFIKKQEHAILLGNLLERLKNYFDFEIEEYMKAPYSGYCMNIPKYNHYVLDNYIMTNVFSRIQNMIRKDKYIDLEKINPAECITPMQLKEDDYSKAFFCYLNYSDEQRRRVLFVGTKNGSFDSPFCFKADTDFEILTSKEFSIELSTILVDFLNNIVDNDSIFPQKDACIKYNEYLQEKLKSGLNISERIALFDGVGKIVAAYNGYEKDDRLSKINSTANIKRTVFVNRIGKKYYLSTDIESGGFEVFDEKRRHLGQFDYKGDQVKLPESLNHNLIV